MTRLLVVISMLVVGCAAGVVPTAAVISTAGTIGVGEQRVLVEFSEDLNGDVVGVLRDENGSPLDRSEGVEVWIIPEERLAYSFVLDIPAAEIYQLTFEVGDAESRPVGFEAVDDPVQAQVGEPAPPVHSNSLSSLVVVFASTTWCVSDSCQPMIDVADEVAGELVVIVEPFVDVDVVDESELELTPTVEEWGLPSQPWLFVIDEAGVIKASFEGGLAESELREALSS